MPLPSWTKIPFSQFMALISMGLRNLPDCLVCLHPGFYMLFLSVPLTPSPYPPCPSFETKWNSVLQFPPWLRRMSQWRKTTGSRISLCPTLSSLMLRAASGIPQLPFRSAPRKITVNRATPIASLPSVSTHTHHLRLLTHPGLLWAMKCSSGISALGLHLFPNSNPVLKTFMSAVSLVTAFLPFLLTYDHTRVWKWVFSLNAALGKACVCWLHGLSQQRSTVLLNSMCPSSLVISLFLVDLAGTR